MQYQRFWMTAVIVVVGAVVFAGNPSCVWAQGAPDTMTATIGTHKAAGGWPEELLAGITLTKAQADTLRKLAVLQDDIAHDLWRGVMKDNSSSEEWQKMVTDVRKTGRARGRAVLTPAQQLVFDKNAKTWPVDHDLHLLDKRSRVIVWF